MSDRNRYLFFLFIFYIITLFSFAGIYYLIYVRDPRSFAFNSDIRASQGEDYNAWAEREIADYTVLVDLLRKLSDQFEKGGNPRPPRRWWESPAPFVTSEHQYTFTQVTIMAAPAGVVDQYISLSIKDNNGNEIRKIRLPNEKFVTVPDNVEEGKKVTTGLISYYEQYMGEVRRRVGTLTSPYPEIWSYWDFLYFSTITQTSVGYGDILPNSTQVRVVVVGHLLISTVMLVLVINLAFPPSRSGIKSRKRKRLQP
ncbi:MAG TPA: potassium channel family protein [Pyrinomonadaceae bacterium]|nr:potassium channel family protein [Pyrinomonadaceae bacterium]